MSINHRTISNIARIETSHTLQDTLDAESCMIAHEGPWPTQKSFVGILAHENILHENSMFPGLVDL